MGDGLNITPLRPEHQPAAAAIVAQMREFATRSIASSSSESIEITEATSEKAAATSEEIGATAQELSNSARQLRETMDRFQKSRHTARAGPLRSLPVAVGILHCFVGE